MKLKFIVITIYSLLLATTERAQEAKSSLKIAPIYDGLCIQSLFISTDNTHGWRCGDLGMLSYTVNGGATWINANNKSAYGLMDIFFLPDNKTGWAVGLRGGILSTVDSGKNWISISDIPTSEDLSGIRFTKNGKIGIAVGDKGTILLSFDAGKTWKQSGDETYDFTGCGFCNNEKTAYVYGNSTSFLIADNTDFSNWNDLIPPEINTQTLRSIINSVAINKKKIIAACSDGYIIRSDNFGKTWNYKRLDIKSDFNSISFDSSFTKGCVISNRSGIFRTVDGGQQWQKIYQLADSGTNFKTVKISADNRIWWIGGKNRLFMTSADSGNNWQSKWPILNTIYKISYLDPKGQEMIHIGNNGYIGHSTDGGANWTRISPPNYTVDFYDYLLDKNSVDLWSVGGDRYTIVHSNISTQASKIIFNSQDSGHFNTIDRNRKDYLFAAGTKSKIVTSKNEGRNWTERKLEPENIILSKLCFSKSDKRGWLIGEKGRLYTTDDNGENWHKSILDPNQFLLSIGFSSDNQTGYIATTSKVWENHLYKSTDAGRTWQKEINFPINAGLQQIVFSNNDNEIFVLAIQGYIYRTIDGGKTWFQLTPKITWQRLTSACFDNKNQPTIAGHSGTLITPQKVDYYPEFIKCFIKDTGEYYKPVISISDKESEPDNIQIAISIKEKLIDGIDKEYQFYRFTYDKIDSVPLWPKVIFPENKTYTFEITICDGWNIVTKEITIYKGIPVSQRIANFMHWDKVPANAEELGKAASMTLLLAAILYALIIVLLYILFPLRFVFWYELMANSRLPYPEKLSKYLVLFLIQSDRSLNAFVTYYRDKVADHFLNQTDVNTRPFWVPSPFVVEHRQILTFAWPDDPKYVPGLSEIKNQLNPDRIIISIEGQGGVGKSTLAFQIAKWASETNTAKRLLPQLMLPILINKVNQNIDNECHSKLQLILDTPVSETLCMALLNKKKIIAVIDGISEMPDIKKEFINPEKGAKNIHAVVYTSRKPVTLEFSSQIIPIGIKLSFLDNLIDGFTNVYVGANKFEDQREILRTRIIDMIKNINESDPNKSIPIILLKLMIDKASELIDQGKDLDKSLPTTFYDLCESYISDMVRNMSYPAQSARKLRNAAVVSLGLSSLLSVDNFEDNLQNIEHVEAQWVQIDKYLQILSPEDIQLFIDGGILVTSGPLDDKRIKFNYDPIAEYLAAKEVCTLLRDKNKALKILPHTINTKPDTFFQQVLIVAKHLDIKVANVYNN